MLFRDIPCDAAIARQERPSARSGNTSFALIYERATDGQTSAHITDIELADLSSNTPELCAALSLLGLTAHQAAA